MKNSSPKLKQPKTLKHLPTRETVQAEKARRSLKQFIHEAWPIIEPGAPYIPNWHIDAISELLEAATRGEIKRFVINIPPRHMKSLSVSVFWPAWVWLTKPESRWLFSSYAQSLATRDSVKCRRLIASVGGSAEGTLLQTIGYQGVIELLTDKPWQLADDQNVKVKFENNLSGYRMATSVGGTATGEGGDYVIVDDPHKADEVASDVKRQAVSDWWDQTMTTRLNDRETGVLGVIMQRLHEQDLTGHLLEKGYYHLCLPAEYEPSHPFVWPDDPRTRPGEPLWPQRMNSVQLAELKQDLGSYAAAGQLQQRPAPLEGGILKRPWWRYYRELPHLTRVTISVDTTFKDKATSDFVVAQAWGAHQANRYLIKQVRGRWDLVETVRQVKDLATHMRTVHPSLPMEVLVENTANGPEIIAELRRHIQGVIPIKPRGDKTQRALAITPQLEAGNIFVPGTPNPDGTGPDTTLTPGWVQDLIEECASFPNGAHDDQVDSLTQALNRLAGLSARNTRKNTKKSQTITSDLSTDRV